MTALLGQILVIALGLGMPGAGAAQTAGGLSVPRENAGGEALSTQDGVMVLQSDGTVSDRGGPVAGGGAPQARDPIINQIIIQIQPPPDTPSAATVGPVHSADAEIRNAQQEALHREAMDRLQDDDADVQLVIPTTLSSGTAGGTAAEAEIGKAQSFEIIKEIMDDDDEHKRRTIQIR